MKRHFNRCEPSGFAVLGREVDQLLKQIFPAEANADCQTGNCQTKSSFAPRAAVVETVDQYEISIDLPGVLPEHVAVEYENEILSISGQRQLPEAGEGRTIIREERSQGNFRRVVQLKEVDGDAITAEFKLGVLTIVAPKLRKPTGKKVEIKVV